MSTPFEFEAWDSDVEFGDNRPEFGEGEDALEAEFGRWRPPRPIAPLRVVRRRPDRSPLFRALRRPPPRRPFPIRPRPFLPITLPPWGRWFGVEPPAAAPPYAEPPLKPTPLSAEPSYAEPSAAEPSYAEPAAIEPAAAEPPGVEPPSESSDDAPAAPAEPPAEEFTIQPEAFAFEAEPGELEGWQLERRANWVSKLAPLLDRHRGDIPLDFLVGWIAVESDGRIWARTTLDERGYFQLHPDESKSLKVDHRRLSTDREYSIRAGIALVRRNAEHAKKLGFTYGTDIFWHIVKLLHWLPGGVRVILDDMRQRGVRPTTWDEFKKYVALRRQPIVAEIKRRFRRAWDPMGGIENVDNLFTRARELSGSAAAGTVTRPAIAGASVSMDTTARRANAVPREQELERLGDLPDDAEFDIDEFEWTGEWGGAPDIGRARRGGTMTIDKVPLLRQHAGIGPDLILTWNDMRKTSGTVDVVVHLHGYSLSKNARLHIGRDLKARSGLDWSDPTGKDSTPGRTRPTLALLPRGHFFGGRSGLEYRFPALTAPGGLRQLIEFGLERLSRSLGIGNLKCSRLILTAHSGGGAALLTILNNVDPHEIHVFDGLYQDAGALIRWAKRRIVRDHSALAQGTTAVERYMAEKGGALRVLYRGRTRTAYYSGPVAEALRKAIPAASPLRRWYRVEQTAAHHVQIPPLYGWRLLANAAADLPGVVPYVSTVKRPQSATRAIARESPVEELKWGVPEDVAHEEEVFATAPPLAHKLVWPAATEEQRGFMRRVYKQHVARSARRRRFVPSVPNDELGDVEHGEVMRKPAAASCVALLAHARANLASEKAQGSTAALKVKDFGARSGYRSVEKQFTGWRSAFGGTYYPDTQNVREKLPGGPHGESAVNYMVEYVGKRIAAPGYSLHNNGLAMDFFTKEGRLSFGPSTNPRNVAAWKGTWLFDWLSRNAGAHHFFQNTSIDEPWHWEYRGPGIAGLSNGGRAS
jgi:hypothetical protein